MEESAVAYFSGMAGAALAMILSGMLNVSARIASLEGQNCADKDPISLYFALGIGAALGTARAGMGVVSLGFQNDKLVRYEYLMACVRPVS
jgi:hypothetical protein